MKKKNIKVAQCIYPYMKNHGLKNGKPSKLLCFVYEWRMRVISQKLHMFEVLPCRFALVFRYFPFLSDKLAAQHFPLSAKQSFCNSKVHEFGFVHTTILLVYIVKAYCPLSCFLRFLSMPCP